MAILKLISANPVWTSASNALESAELANLPVGLSRLETVCDEYRLGDLISYQNDRKYSMAGSRKAGDRE